MNDAGGGGGGGGGGGIKDAGRMRGCNRLQSSSGSISGWMREGEGDRERLRA